MPVLHDILYQVRLRSVIGSTAIDVGSLHIDSREVQPGGCFIAVRGTATDGHTYISKAIDNGAACVICEQMPKEIHEQVTYIEVQDTSVAAGLIAHEFYGRPSHQLKLVGVTGTNGKTTVATLLYRLFCALDHMAGLISTVCCKVGQEEIHSTHTTPDPLTLNALLRRMVDAGCTHVFMECSSHAIHQRRIEGLAFTGAIFTNITHDHLDYHKTFDEYIRVKKSFFDGLSADAFAISNLDDKRGTVMLQNTPADKFYYALRSIADFKGRVLENGLNGLLMLVNEQEVHFRLIGEFNAYNLLAVYAAAVCLGEDRQDVLREMSRLEGAEGRFDRIISPEDRITGVVDYAHTPDALQNVLSTLRKVAASGERIITVVGCGGNRDKAKRPVMGQVAAAHSDRTVFTSDNPRDERPEDILQEMEAGVTLTDKRKVIVIADRREAIKTAVSLASPGDIVLIAGKGHEKYQEINGVRIAFDDRQVLEEMFRMLGK